MSLSLSRIMLWHRSRETTENPKNWPENLAPEKDMPPQANRSGIADAGLGGTLIDGMVSVNVARQPQPCIEVMMEPFFNLLLRLPEFRPRLFNIGIARESL